VTAICPSRIAPSSTRHGRSSTAPRSGPPRSTLYYPEGCLDNVPNGVDYEARATRALEAYEASAINRELATGALTGNPSLWSTANIIPSVALPAFDALKAFAAQAETHGGPGELVVHSPSWTAGSYTRERLAFFANDPANERPGWRTPHGFNMNMYSGLTGTDGLVTSLPAPNLIDPWVYMTGRIWVGKGPIRFAQDDSSFRHHKAATVGELVQAAAGTTVTAERELLVFFNPCLSWGLQLDASI